MPADSARGPDPSTAVRRPALRRGKRLGKYRLVRRLGRGGFADVWRAVDTIEAISVALKIPLIENSAEGMEALLHEIRLASRLDHPNIVRIKNADVIQGVLVVAYPLGERTLSDRLRHRIATRAALSIMEQVLAALAHAHQNRVIHCDVKPENVVLFPDGRACLTDFGISKIAVRTVLAASGSGTIGYLAPEQAMGKPSIRSDVFSAGLLLYRMLSGALPEWPFEWPPRGLSRVKRRVGPALVSVIRKSLRVRGAERYVDAGAMLDAFRRARPAPEDPGAGAVRRRAVRGTVCSSCRGAVSEEMAHCPHCGRRRRRHVGPVRFPAHCPSCGRGRKLDWKYCPWCYRKKFPDVSTRSYRDARYTERCANRSCGGPLMRFMRYCPWCHRKVTRRWEVPGGGPRCHRCGWGGKRADWKYCAWCGTAARDRGT